MTTINPETYDRWFVNYTPGGTIHLTKVGAGILMGTGQPNVEEFLAVEDAVARALDLGLDANAFQNQITVEPDPEDANKVVFSLDDITEFFLLHEGDVIMSTNPPGILPVGAVCTAKGEEPFTATWSEPVNTTEETFEITYFPNR